MFELPVINSFSQHELNEILSVFNEIKLISKENRQNFSGEFPSHTRYFSNGDKPLVALITITGNAVFGYGNKSINLSAGDFIFFDDSQPHSWVFKDCDLEIYYYRLVEMSVSIKITDGDYCLDNYFC